MADGEISDSLTGFMHNFVISYVDNIVLSQSMTASLTGLAIKDGYIKSIDDQVMNCVPKLNGSAYDGVVLRHQMQMASTVKRNETYVDPKSDRRRMLTA